MDDIYRLDSHIVKLVAELHVEREACVGVSFGLFHVWSFGFLDVCMHTCLDVPLKWMWACVRACMLPLHVSVHRLQNLFLQCFFRNHSQCSVISNRFLSVCGLQRGLSSSCLHFSQGSFRSALAESSSIVAFLHAFEGDVDDGNQALCGAQGAEQPVRIGLSQDPQDIALVKAQLARLCGYVVAQCSYFAVGWQRTWGKGEQEDLGNWWLVTGQSCFKNNCKTFPSWSFSILLFVLL